jgi:hypothetical protein
MYAAPARRWVVPNSAMPGMKMVGAKTMQNHGLMLGVQLIRMEVVPPKI